jgi:arylsulfatase A-like enzyme
LKYIGNIIWEEAVMQKSDKIRKKPNIVFILIDDMGWKDLTCYGSSFYETPNIDRLAREGMLFTDAYAACPVCSPTRGSILTGKYPATLGITDWIDSRGKIHPCKGKLVDVPYIKYLPIEEKTIASALKDGGYTTWHVGKWHLGNRPYYPENHGFDVNIGGCNWGSPYNGYFSPYGIETLEEGSEGEYLTDRITDEAIKLIKSDNDKPFFLNLWHYAVHRLVGQLPIFYLLPVLSISY